MTTHSHPNALSQAENVLAILRTLLRDTPFWDELKLSHSEDLGPATKLCDAQLKADTLDDPWQAYFHKFWARDGGGRNPDGFFVAKEDAPRTLGLRTYNRRAFSQYVPAIAKALDGLPVELVEDKGWTWDHEVRRKNGGATHRTAYELKICFDSASRFKSKLWLKTALEFVCASTDPRADEDIFEMEEDAFGRANCTSYQQTRGGWLLEYPTLAQAEKVVQTLFANCSTKITRKKDFKTDVEVVLLFPEGGNAKALNDNLI